MKTYASKKSRIQLAKDLAAEGIVLLKNTDNLLPLKPGTSIAVFGRAQLQTLIGGGGSGASSSEEATVILEELKKSGLKPVAGLEDFYRSELAKALADSPSEEEARAQFADLVSSGMIYEIFGRYTPPAPEFSPPENFLPAISAGIPALCVIGRGSGGEECDRRVEEDYYLTGSEKQLVETVAKHFDRVILVLNINGFIDLSWTCEYPSIKSVLYLGTAGEQGAAALSDIITGRISPSGKLSATLAPSYEDYPSSPYFFTNKDKPETILTYKDFGLPAKAKGSTGFEKSPAALYQEGIYVGYRYFDTFNKPVLYPFGYGLSYADFDLEFLASRQDGETLFLTVKIKNKSREFSGKEVAELYVSAPDGKLEKPYQELLAYEKSKSLAPGESELLTLSLNLRELAGYDEETASFLIEAGDYYLRLGNSSRNTKIIGKLQVPETIVVARYQNRLVLNTFNKERLNFLRKAGHTPYTYPGEAKEKKQASCLCKLTGENIPVFTPGEVKEDPDRMDITPPTGVKAPYATDPAIITDHKKTDTVSIGQIGENKSPAGERFKLMDVKTGKITMEDFTAQFSPEELAVLVNGYGPGLPFGGMGGKYPATISYENGEPIAVSTHPTGSAGYLSPALIKYGIPSVFYKDGPAGVQLTAWPTGMPMACTFNKKLLYEFGHACGTEAELLYVDSWLAPAVNIQRNPIGGRNFEYYSEDPRHTGFCGLAITLGVEENNQVTACPKHFALNEQETYRRGSTKKSCDALDSIVEERAAREIYLKPFEMIVRGSRVSTLMTSFNKINGTFAAGSNDLCTGILREEWGYRGIVVTDWGDMDIVVDGGDAVAAGNDIIMPGGPPVIKQVLEGFKEGRVTLAGLRKAASGLLTFVMNSRSFDQYNKDRRN